MSIPVFESPEHNMTRRALWARQVEVFLNRRLMDIRDDKRVVITFATTLEAEEFHKLLLAQKGRAK